MKKIIKFSILAILIVTSLHGTIAHAQSAGFNNARDSRDLGKSTNEQQRKNTEDSLKEVTKQLQQQNREIEKTRGTISNLQTQIKNEKDPKKKASLQRKLEIQQDNLKTTLNDPIRKQQEKLRQQLLQDLNKNEADAKKIQADFEKKVEAGIAPDIHAFKSKLLPGEKTADFRGYFIDSIIPRAIRLLISLTAAASVIMIIYGGYRILFYVGDSENLEAGKNTIKWAVIGLLISLFAYAIVSIVTSLANL